MSNLAIQASIKSLDAILANTNNYYSIPDYQRPYAWGKDNVDNLLYDIYEAYERDEKQYFCGTIVLKDRLNEKDARFDIIDGQQRLTTFVIIAAVLNTFFVDDLEIRAKDKVSHSTKSPYEKNCDKLKIQTDTNESITFSQKIVKKVDLEGDIKSIYIKNASYVKEFFSKKKDKNLNIDEFVNYIYDNVCLAEIICPNEDIAINIFNVLNNRGLPLNPIDILKSHLMMKLDSEGRNLFKKTWDNILIKLDNNNLSVNELLTTFTYYLIATNPSKRADKEVLDYYEKKYKDGDFDALEALRDIDDFTNSYIAVMSEESKEIYALYNLKNRAFWIAILSTAKILKRADINRLARLLVAYYYKSWIADGTTSRIKGTSFDIIKMLKEKHSIEKIKSKIVLNLNKYKSDELFEKTLRDRNIYGNKRNLAKALLMIYENELSEIPRFLKNENITLEHILPQTIKGTTWENLFDEKQVEEYTNCLANLVLLSKRKNIQASNSDFVKKREAYTKTDSKTTPYISTIVAINDKEQWLASDIDQRQEMIIAKLRDCFDIDKI